MATTSNPILQVGNAVFVIEENKDNSPIKEIKQGSPLFYRGIVVQVYWDENANTYGYMIDTGTGRFIELNETAYNVWMHTTYNTARSLFRAKIDTVFP